MKKNSLWLVYAIFTMVSWGVWMALAGYPGNNGFPQTLGYVAWALTMIPPAIVALFIINWKLEHDLRSIALGLVTGLLGAGGQLIILRALPLAPEYLIWSFIALSPIVTIILAVFISREKVAALGWFGIVMAIGAGVLLSWGEPGEEKVKSLLWVLYASLTLVAWGVQGFVISHANKTMKAESIFFYMMLGALMLIPVAIGMTDFDQEINWGFKGPVAALLIHTLNSVGALLIVYAFRYGKAVIIAPMTNAGAPVITIIISISIILMNGGDMPFIVQIIGMVLAIIAAILMTWEESEEASEAENDTAAIPEE